MHNKSSISETITLLRFPLTVFIVMYHCFCWMTPQEQPLYAALVYPFGLMMGETGVPAFFFISGFLFFLNQRSYGEKLKARVSSLLLPYVLWNALVLLAYVVLMFIGHPQDIAGKSIADYQFLDYLRAFVDRGVWDNGNGQPMLCPFWYVRNLMMLSIAAPLIRYLVMGTKGILLLMVLLVWWISVPYNGMMAQSVLFFSIGAYFSVKRLSPILTQNSVYTRAVMMLWLFLAVLDWLAHTCISIWGGLYIHRLVLVANIFILFLVGTLFSKNIRVIPLLQKSCFWIYAFHYLFTILLRHISPVKNDWMQFAVYMLSVMAILMVCIATYAIGRRLMPQVVNVLTGNR